MRKRTKELSPISSLSTASRIVREIALFSAVALGLMIAVFWVIYVIFLIFGG